MTEINSETIGILLETYGPWGLAGAGFLVFLFGFRTEIRAVLKHFIRTKPELPSAYEVLQATITQKRKGSYLHSVPYLDCRQTMLLRLEEIRYEVIARYLGKTQRWDVSDFDSTELYRAVLSVANDALLEGERLAKEDGIHPAIIAVFRHLTFERTNLFLTVARSICERKEIPTNEKKVEALYGILDAIIRNVSLEADVMIAQFEHEFAGFEYKGKVCGNREQLTKQQEKQVQQ